MHRYPADDPGAIPKVVFSRTLGSVPDNARLAQESVAEEAVAALGATEKDVSIGGAGLAARAIELGLVEAAHVPQSVVVGGAPPLCRRAPEPSRWS
jgi:hypothetical protein